MLYLDVSRAQQLPTGPDHGFQADAVAQVAAVAHPIVLANARDPRQGRDLVGDTTGADRVDRHLQQQRRFAPDPRDAISAGFRRSRVRGSRGAFRRRPPRLTFIPDPFADRHALGHIAPAVTLAGESEARRIRLAGGVDSGDPDDVVDRPATRGGHEHSGAGVKMLLAKPAGPQRDCRPSRQSQDLSLSPASIASLARAAAAAFGLVSACRRYDAVSCSRVR